MAGHAPISDALAATEKLSARGAVAPRVAIPDIEALIAREYYINAGQAVGVDTGVAPSPLSMLTICLLEMNNGFVEVGWSAPASPENYDPDKGRTFAKENAVRRMWPKLGYVLREKLHETDTSKAAPGALP
jgi:hypothetical protein